MIGEKARGHVLHLSISRPFGSWALLGLGIALALGHPRAAWPASWERGIKIGADAATFRGDFADLVGSEHRTGFVGGIFVTRRISPRFGLQTEALYAMKGSKDSFEITDASGTLIGPGHIHWVLKYIEVPVLARISLAPSARVRPEVILGPSLGFKLDGKLSVEGSSFPSTELTQLKTFDLGVVAGMGFSVGRGPYKGLLDLRYTTGLSSALDTGPGGLDAVNSVFSFMAGVSF
jgi:hypothetical protein